MPQASPFRRAARRLTRNEAGATAIEFGLIGMFFFMFITSSIEVMMIMQAQSVLQWSVGAAARSVMLNPGLSLAEVGQEAQKVSDQSGYTKASGATYSASQQLCSSNSQTNCVTVLGTYRYVFKLSTLGKGSITLSERAVAPLLADSD